jgi:CRP-like cAMP-binding protein
MIAVPSTMRLDPVTLRCVALFATLSDEDCSALAHVCEGHRYAAGELVFREGDPGETMLFVTQGELTVSERVDGSMEHLGHVGPGQLLGEAALIVPGPRVTTACASRPSCVYAIGRSALESLREVAPVAARVLTGAAIGDVARRLRQLEHRVERELEREALAP